MQQALPQLHTSADPTQALRQRLEWCADKMGGKRALAEAAGLSEAQLFRYLRGASEPTLGKLLALSKAAGVPYQWLICGHSEQMLDTAQLQKSQLRLLEQVVRTLEEAMLEFAGTFSPSQKSLLVPLLFSAAQMEQAQGQTPQHLQRPQMLRTLHYLYPVKDAASLRTMLEGLDALSGRGPINKDMSLFVNVVCRAGQGLFESKVGELYFDRITYDLNQTHLHLMHQFCTYVVERFGRYKQVDVLDIGCGNGRHMAYIKRFMAQLGTLRGVDTAPRAIALCQQAIAQGLLPPGSVQQADIRTLPFADGCMDVLNVMSLLQYIPHIPGRAEGLGQALSEMARVLRPGGLAHLMVRAGDEVEYMPYLNSFTPAKIEKLVTGYGFEVLSTQPLEFTSEMFGIGADVPAHLRQVLVVWLKKA